MTRSDKEFYFIVTGIYEHIQYPKYGVVSRVKKRILGHSRGLKPQDHKDSVY